MKHRPLNLIMLFLFVKMGAPLADSIGRALRYVLRDGRTLVEGQEPKSQRTFERVFKAPAGSAAAQHAAGGSHHSLLPSANIEGIQNELSS